MMKRILFCVLAVFSMSVVAATPDQVVKESMKEYMAANDIPGAAVVVYVDGKPHSYYFGYADTEKKKPVTAKTIFEVGSISKVMTSLLLAEDLDFAKVQLGDPVTKYLPTLPEKFSDVTLKSLATHTSGLPFTMPASVKTREDWQDFASDWSPKYEPEEGYQYSNIGIGVLGEALAAVGHTKINTLYRKKILSRLGMQPIGITVPKKLRKYVATGYDQDGDPVAPIRTEMFPAADGIKVSGSDMRKFLRASIGLPKTPESIFYPMRMTQTPYAAMGDYKQGLGWQIHDLNSGTVSWLMRGGDKLGLQSVAVDQIFAEPTFDGNSLIDKTGSTNGFRAYIAVIPNKKTGIVIMANRHVTDGSIKATARKILFKLNDMA